MLVKKLLVLSFLVSLTLSLTGCGNGKNKASSYEIYASVEEMREALNTHNVFCADAADCPGYATKLVMWKRIGARFGLGTCSGTLYKNKYIISNAHCIPENLNTGSNCSDKLKVLFPKTNFYNEESARCLRIIQVYGKGGPDLAVFELDRSVFRGDSVAIAPNTFEDGSNVYAHTMNPIKGTTSGYIIKKSCKVSLDNSYSMDPSSNSAEAVIYGNSCNLIGGNSGSGLMKDGKLIGAAFAGLDDDYDNYFKNHGINLTVTESTGFAQNIGCLNSITTNSGVGCDIFKITPNVIDGFIKRAKLKHGFQNTPDSQLKYSLTNGLKLKLQKVSFVSGIEALDSFRVNWNKFYVSDAINMTSSKLLKDNLN